MKYIFFITTFSLMLVTSLAPALVAEARTVIRSGQAVSVAEDQVIEGDFYSVGNIINISGQVTEDISMAGADVTINGSVGDDALIIAGRTDVHGQVGDDLRIVSGEVTIAEPIQGDVFVLGGFVNILSTAEIEGDLILYAKQVTLDGLVKGDVIGAVDIMRIDSAVNGDVDITVSDLTLGDRANVAGNVLYDSHQTATKSLNATVGGELVRNDPILPGQQSSAGNAVLPILVLLFSALVWYLVSRKTLLQLTEHSIQSPFRTFVVGVSVIIFTPLVVSLLTISMIGTLVGVSFFVAYILLVLLSAIACSAVLGKFLMSIFNKPKADFSLVTLIVGVVGTILLLMIPVVGILVILLSFCIAMGSIVDQIYKPLFR